MLYAYVTHLLRIRMCDTCALTQLVSSRSFRLICPSNWVWVGVHIGFSMATLSQSWSLIPYLFIYLFIYLCIYLFIYLFLLFYLYSTSWPRRMFWNIEVLSTISRGICRTLYNSGWHFAWVIALSHLELFHPDPCWATPFVEPRRIILKFEGFDQCYRWIDSHNPVMYFACYSPFSELG